MNSRALQVMVVLFCLSSVVETSDAQSSGVKLPITVTNIAGHSAGIQFGVNTEATYCIDPFLGEFELPAGGCSGSEICAFFRDVRSGNGSCLGNGVLLDLRPYLFRTQVDTYRVVFSSDVYPTTFHWPLNLGAYYDSVKIFYVIGLSVNVQDVEMVDSLMLMSPLISQFDMIAYGPKGTVTAAAEGGGRATRFSLYQNYPNPFNPTTTIKFEVAHGGYVSVKIFDVLGCDVATLESAYLPPGVYTRDWDASTMTSGVYFYRLQSSDFVDVKKLLLMK